MQEGINAPAGERLRRTPDLTAHTPRTHRNRRTAGYHPMDIEADRPPTDAPAAEAAHVLYLDMAGYSRLPLRDQVRVVQDLHALVRGTEEFRRCEASGDLLRSDTGDGMALVFFADPLSPIRCACEIAAATGMPARLPLRIGLHSGPIIRRRDINGRENVSGDGVNLAQRVMDCGDPGHILLSKSYADLLRRSGDWAAGLHDLGDALVKHGLQMPVVSFHREGCGNPALPRRLDVLVAPAPPPPTNLPFWRTDQFVGRAPTLSLVHGLLSAAAPVALVGLSGLGKTQLALHYAHLHPQDYPGGLFWINAADSSHVREDYATLARSFFGIPETLSAEVCVARLRDRLHHLSQPTLFVFDNVTEETDLSLLPASPHCRLLLTTQQKHLAPSGFELVELPKLGADDAAALLHGPGAVPDGDERAAARQIADAVGRLPLALALIAQHRSRLRLGLADYRRRLFSPPSENRPAEDVLLRTLERAREKFVAATGHKGRIYETIERSYLSLDPAARTVLAAAACFAPAGFGRDLLLDVLGPAEVGVWEEALADLVDASLISEDEAPAEPGEAGPDPAPRLRLHELVRLFARMQLSEEEHRAHVARLAAALTDRLRRANEELDWRGVRPEMAHLTAAIAESRDHGLDESLHPLLRASGEFLILQRDFAHAAAHLQEALRLVERLHGPVHAGRARLLLLLGEVDQGQGDVVSALRNVRAALRLVRRVGAPESEDLLDYFGTMGYILKEKGQLKRAQMFSQKALALCILRSGPDHPKVSLCRSNLAMVLAKRGELGAAEACLRASLETERLRATQNGPTAAMSVYWNNLGKVLREQGRWREALAYHEAALQNYRRIHGPIHTDVASSLYLSAVAHEALHQWPEARTHYQEVLELYRQLYGDDGWRSEVVRGRLALLEPV